MFAFFASGGLLLLLDQGSKRLAENLTRNRFLSFGSLLRFHGIANARIRYRHSYTRASLLCLWFAALLAAWLLYRHGDWFQSRLSLVGLGLAFGGAAGNLLDTLRRRSVVDFIHFLRWPAFNLADVAIFGGLLVAFLASGVN